MSNAPAPWGRDDARTMGHAEGRAREPRVFQRLHERRERERVSDFGAGWVEHGGMGDRAAGGRFGSVWGLEGMWLSAYWSGLFAQSLLC